MFVLVILKVCFVFYVLIIYRFIDRNFVLICIFMDSKEIEYFDLLSICIFVYMNCVFVFIYICFFWGFCEIRKFWDYDYNVSIVLLIKNNCLDFFFFLNNSVSKYIIVCLVFFMFVFVLVKWIERFLFLN